MIEFLGRLWAGIVGAVAGTSVGLVIAILLAMFGYSLNDGLWAILIFAILGGIFGFVFGSGKTNKKDAT
jgi:hypothetical protein